MRRFHETLINVVAPIMRKPWLMLILTAVFFLLVPAGASADDDLELYFEGLRQRRLHQLAERFGRDRLSRPDLPDEERVRITTELSRTYVDHALQSTPGEEEARWDQAREVLREFAEEDLPLPLRLHLELQRAQVDFSQGEANRWRYDLLPHDSSLRDTARLSLRSSINRLESIRGLMGDSARGSDRGRGEPQEQLSLSQRRALLRNLDRRQARGLMNLAQTYPAGSPDRLDTLHRAVALLQPLAGTDVGDELAWSSTVDLAECQRLMGNLDGAKAALEEIGNSDPPAEVLDRALALNVRLLLAQGRVESALTLLEDHRRALTSPSDELEFLLIEALLSKWRQLGTEHRAAADQLRARVMNLIRQLHTRKADYWARRAGLLLARDVRQGNVEGGIPLLITAAESLYRSNRFAEAAEVYAMASHQAEILGHTAEAFELGFSRAAVFTQAEDYEAASAAFRTLAIQHPSHARAAESHLMAAFTQGRRLANRTTPENQQAYRQILEEHLARFAASDTTAEARWLLGRLDESQGRYREAVAQYRRIPLEHPRAAESHEAAGRSFDAWMHEARQTGSSLDEILTEAAGFFQQVFRETRQSGPGGKSDLYYAAGVRLARIWLSAAPPRYREAERVLERMLAGSSYTSKGLVSESPEAVSLNEARQLLVVALAGQGQMQEAERHLRELAQGSSKQTLQLLTALDEVGLAADPQVQRALGELQLKLLDSLQAVRHRFDEPGRFQLDLSAARASARVGKTDEALALFDRLEEQRPNDLELLKVQGDVLMSLDRKETYRLAGDVWRKLESLTSPKSTLWYHARYQLALSYYELGDLARCRKLIGVTRLLHPDLGNAELKRRFDELWRRSQPIEG